MYASLTLQGGAVAMIKLGLSVVVLVTGYLNFTLLSCLQIERSSYVTSQVRQERERMLVKREA